MSAASFRAAMMMLTDGSMAAERTGRRMRAPRTRSPTGKTTYVATIVAPAPQKTDLATPLARPPRLIPGRIREVVPWRPGSRSCVRVRPGSAGVPPAGVWPPVVRAPLLGALERRRRPGRIRMLPTSVPWTMSSIAVGLTDHRASGRAAADDQDGRTDDARPDHGGRRVGQGARVDDHDVAGPGHGLEQLACLLWARVGRARVGAGGEDPGVGDRALHDAVLQALSVAERVVEAGHARYAEEPGEAAVRVRVDQDDGAPLRGRGSKAGRQVRPVRAFVGHRDDEVAPTVGGLAECQPGHERGVVMRRCEAAPHPGPGRGRCGGARADLADDALSCRPCPARRDPGCGRRGTRRGGPGRRRRAGRPPTDISTISDTCGATGAVGSLAKSRTVT